MDGSAFGVLRQKPQPFLQKWCDQLLAGGDNFCSISPVVSIADAASAIG